MITIYSDVIKVVDNFSLLLLPSNHSFISSLVSLSGPRLTDAYLVTRVVHCRLSKPSASALCSLSDEPALDLLFSDTFNEVAAWHLSSSKYAIA